MLPEQSRRLETTFIVATLFAASCLFLLNLANHYLWQDEAQTALISKTILTHGVPLGYDGKNYLSQELGAEYGENYLWRWHTWLPFYVAAASFRLFGANTFSARLPFALFGIGTVVLAYFFAKSLWKSPRAGVVTSTLLLLSVPFIILSRQSRYYSMAAFFSLLCLYAYANILERKKYSHVVFVVSATLLFHTHYIYCATLLVTVVLHTLLCHRDAARKVVLSSAVVVAISLPFIIWLAGIRYGDRYGTGLFDAARVAGSGKKYFLHVVTHVFSPLLLLVPACVGAANWIRTKSLFPKDAVVWNKLFLLILFIALNVIALSLTSPAPFFRYLAPLIPVLYVITGFIINSAMNVHVALGPVLMAVLVFMSPLSDYLYEITHDYDGPIEGISKYLNDNGNRDDTVAITYGDLPLKFYTSMRVVGGLTGEDLAPAKKAEWIILRNHVICRKDYNVLQYLLKNVPWHMYQRITIDYPDIPFENRESPDEHRFRTTIDASKVAVFRRVKNSRGQGNSPSRKYPDVRQ
ncbi:MAG: glycosyltransferase family 39 protein [Candidatus Hydrogenedentes bacterium]|nr:glycosyltransferase family 39 protein [Candidatus Hydrogenedentota bacterium]